MDPQIAAFVLLSAVLTVTPGADMALVARHALAAGRGAAFRCTLGICLGVAIHAVLSALGLSAVLSRSARLYEIVRMLGAAYLIYLGVRTVWESRLAMRQATALGTGELAPPHGGARAPGRRGDGVPGRAASRGAVRAFGEGLLTNLMNPKVALFYVTLLPQFIGPGDAVLVRSLALAGIHITFGLLWLSWYAYLLGRLRAFLGRGAVRCWLERLTGALLVGLGLGVAWERR